MFARLLSTVCWPSDNAGLVTDVSLDLAGHCYVVRFSHSARRYSVANGTVSAVVPDVVVAGRQQKNAATCTECATLILGRELRRRGISRKPKSEAVLELASTLAHEIRQAHADFKAPR